jgi:hypothetical protein
MSTTPNIRTTADQKFEQAKQIYSIAEQLSDAVVVLRKLCCAIGGHISHRNKLLEKSAFIKKIIIWCGACLGGSKTHKK